MDMNDLKDWAGRAAAGGPPLTPDEGASAAEPEAPAADPHECSVALRSFSDSAKTFGSDLKAAVEKAKETHPDADLKKVEDLLSALETGAADLASASDEVQALEEEAEEEREEEADDEEDEDDDGPPGSA